MAQRKKVVSGSHHQGNISLYGPNAGSQCVANVQSFILHVTNSDVKMLKKRDIDQILSLGNQIYDSAKRHARQTELIPTELPCIVGSESGRYEVSPILLLHGTLSTDVEELTLGLTRAFGYCSTLYFTIKGGCIGLLYGNDKYYLFDSHSRDNNGFTCVDGRACIIHFASFVQMSNYLKKQYGQTGSEPFQIVGCKVDNFGCNKPIVTKGFYVDETSYRTHTDITEDVVCNEQYVSEVINSCNSQKWYRVLKGRHRSKQMAILDGSVYDPNSVDVDSASSTGRGAQGIVECSTMSLGVTEQEVDGIIEQDMANTSVSETGEDDMGVHSKSTACRTNESSVNSNKQSFSPLASAAHASKRKRGKRVGLESRKTKNHVVTKDTESSIREGCKENVCAADLTCTQVFRSISDEKRKERNNKRSALRSLHKRAYAEGVASEQVQRKCKEDEQKKKRKKKMNQKQKKFCSDSDSSVTEIDIQFDTSTVMQEISSQSRRKNAYLDRPCCELLNCNDTNRFKGGKVPCKKGKELKSTRQEKVTSNNRNLHTKVGERHAANVSNCTTSISSSQSVPFAESVTGHSEDSNGTSLERVNVDLETTHYLEGIVDDNDDVESVHEDHFIDCNTFNMLELNEGCDYICCSCEQIYFWKSVQKISQHRQRIYAMYIDEFDSNRSQSEYYICYTCNSAILKNKVPKLSKYNGMVFPLIPPELKISAKEASLISPRVVFLNMHVLPSGCQLSLYGNVISVPAEIETAICSLPRFLNAEGTVSLRLKRRLNYKSVYRHLNVRPHAVMIALRWLLANSILYDENEISINNEWLEETIKFLEEHANSELENPEEDDVVNHPTICIDDASGHIEGVLSTSEIEANGEDRLNSNVISSDNIKNSNTVEESVQTTVQVTAPNGLNGNTETSVPSTSEDGVQNVNNGTNLDTNVDSDDGFSEVDPTEYNSLLNTLLDQECDTRYLDIAPGEANFPRNIYYDTYGEELAFPCIYAGKKMLDLYPRNIQLCERLRWELRNKDRRVAENSEKIFYMYKKYQNHYIQTKQSFALRLLKNKNYRNRDVNDIDSLKKIAGVNDGFFFFQHLRNTPMYLNSRKSDLLATIRQLGIPTWFVSLSSADTRWPGLLKCLCKVVNNNVLSDEEIEDMSFQDRCKLLNSDPVTASRYFDNRMSYFLRKIIYSKKNPIGKVVDHFYKIEFQHRGSPHVHMLIFTSDRPKYLSPQDSNDLAKFVDTYASCSLEVDNETKELVKIQTHKHSRTCRKKGKAICRFHFPIPPMRKTCILMPLVDTEPVDRENFKKIKDFLNAKDNTDMSHDEMLQQLEMTDETYIRAVCTSIDEDKLFLKRKVNECRVNAYMKNLIKVWQGNHDIQFCLNVYSVVTYIVSYIQKTNRGLSLALSKVRQEFKNDPQGVRDQVKAIGKVFLGATEISVQECAYMLLGLPMCQNSRDIAFINTAPKAERIKVLREKEYLDNSNPNCTNICFDSIFEKYAKRPKRFDTWCLADFATRLRIVYEKKYETELDEDENDELPPDSTNNSSEGNEQVLLNCRNLKYTLRKKKKILKYHIPKSSNPRETINGINLLLFYPWRNEDIFTEQHDCYTDFINDLSSLEKDNLPKKMEEYNQESPTFMQNLDEETSRSELPDNVAPSTAYAEERDREAQTIPLSGEDFFIAEPCTSSTSGNYTDDTNQISGINVTQRLCDTVETLWPQEQILPTVNTLNFKQRCIYNHVLKHVIQNQDSIHLCITGGAGVGKSVVLRLLYQSMSRFFNLSPDDLPNVESVKCLAYTGKAAFLINGETLHSSLGIQPSTSYRKYVPLCADRLNTLRMKWKDVKALLIDEISLVGSTFFAFMNRRLQDLMGSNKILGGLHIICFGDFFQLAPVCDNMIFMPANGDIACMGTNLWKEYFVFYELTQIMRQQGDIAFAEALNRIRKGVIEQRDVNMIKEREIALDLSSDVPQILCAQNNLVEKYNQQLYDQCTQHKCVVPCKDTVLGNTLDKNYASILKKISDDPKKTGSLCKSLNVGVGLIYDIIVNLDVKDGLANGTTGEVKRIEYMPGYSKPFIIWFDFSDPNIGKKQAETYKQYYNENVDKNWIPICPISKKFNVGANYTEVSRTQFPLKQSGAKTVHKSQGCTVDRVIVHITGSFRPYMRHMMYVALSRVTSLSGLNVINFHDKYIRVSKAVLEDDKDSLTTRKCILNSTFFERRETPTLNIYYENVQSFTAHFECIKNHLAIQNTHLIMLVESKLKEEHLSGNFIIPDYEMIRLDQCYSGNSHVSGGLLVYIHKSVKIERTAFYQADGVEMIQFYIVYRQQRERYVLLYKHPSTTRAAVLQALRSLNVTGLFTIPFTIIGDFNVDVTKHENLSYVSKIEDITTLKLQICSPTTKRGTQIDLVFSNYPMMCCTQYLPWSLHFGISCYREITAIQT